jgi:glyoxylase-like metal-dependent hydrolase (beta-lactamase superfamily II)
MQTQDLGAGVSIDKLLDDDKWLAAADAMFPDATDEAMEEAFRVLGPRHIDPGSRCVRLSLHSFIVRTRHHIIIVDTCYGNDKERPGRPMSHHRNTDYLGNLRRFGVRPEQVDFVFCTHLHGDHVGWNTRLLNGRWVPTFPKARYVMSRVEHDHWLALSWSTPPAELNAGSFADSVLPVIEAGQAWPVEEGQVVCDHVEIELVPGHTPGNMVVHLLGDRRAALTGDVLHSPIQLHFPDWSTRFDSDQALARINRLKLVERHADGDTLILPAHFVDPTAGRIRRAGARYGYVFAE